MYSNFQQAMSVITKTKNVLFLCVLTFIQVVNAQEKEKHNIVQKKINDAVKNTYLIDKSYLDFLEDTYKNHLKLKDTLNATIVLLEKCLIHEHNAEYSKSYDLLWTALLLNDNTSNDSIKSIIYNKLGRIYSYSKRKGKSIEFLNKSLTFQKKKIKKFGLNQNELTPIYFSFTKTLRETNQIDLAKKYLDSCYLYFDSEYNFNRNPYFGFKGKALLDFEKALLLYYNGNTNKAIQILKEIKPWFENNWPTYLVLFYKYLADMHNNYSDFLLKETMYLKSIRISKKYNAHIDFTPLVYEALADLYAQNGDYFNAFKNIEKAKTLDFTFFDSRSPNNQSLLEIKDDYIIEKNRQKKEALGQYLTGLEQKDRIKNLQRTILVVVIVFLIITGLYLYKYLKNKHLNEKLLISKKNQLEIKKANELVNFKNKELAASALRLVEKEEVLMKLKEHINQNTTTPSKSELKKIIKSVDINYQLGWDEFNIRFTQVNKEFYQNLKEAYPNLSQNDHKICALIKLNLSSKEMSKLLNISVESVHTNRHRIRKKMNLQRDINLEDYICSL